MDSERSCCVPSCKRPRSPGTPLHGFPNPVADPDRFRTWLHAIGGDILSLDNQYIYKYRHVCRHHFKPCYHFGNRRLTNIAIPTLNMPGKKTAFTGLQNVRNLMSKSLYYSEFGDPLHVVKFREMEVPPLKSQEVLVRMLAAPVNPADINTIQGKYPVKITLPVIPGNEGVGVVEEISSDVKNICLGNRVIVTEPIQGTWRDIGVFREDVLRVVPDNLGLVEAATLTVNPCTAYRMLSDFKNVKDGQVVIQNGANSACGQNIIQICKAWGVKNINIVRNRPEINELKKYLECLGATYVLTEEELRTTTLFKEKQIRKPILALNCVGGKSALEIVRHLDKTGVMVTYGAMSRDPVTIPNAALIFKNISFHGFWMTAWREKATEDEKEKMMADIVSLMCEKKLVGPVHKMVKFDKYEEALGNALSSKGFTGCKYILDFSCSVQR